METKILVAEDEARARTNICRVLRHSGYRVDEAADGNNALVAIDTHDFAVVLAALQMPGADGLTVLKHVQEVSPQTLVLLMIAYASVETVVEALHLGAQDYLLKPIVGANLLRNVRTLLAHRDQVWELQQLRRAVNRYTNPTALFVGRSQVMQEVSDLIDKVAAVPSTVLITGESGVGKEVVARAIHLRSPCANHIFLPVNCSAIPEPLLESQLFGHVKGAFTNALTSHEGLFRRAQGGTIFLDEIGELPLALQAKLLRAIEGKEVLPVGATTPVHVDVRIIAATNRDLAKEIEAGRFRADLYYRLNVISVHIPPLRERSEDIPVLVEHLIRRHNRTLKTMYKGVDHAAMKLLRSLPWKGNIRELDHALEQAMILGNGKWVTPAELTQGKSPEERGSRAGEYRLAVAAKAYEKSHIEYILHETRGDRTRAADILGLSRSSLYRRIERLGISLGRHTLPDIPPTVTAHASASGQRALRRREGSGNGLRAQSEAAVGHPVSSPQSHFFRTRKH